MSLNQQNSIDTTQTISHPSSSLHTSSSAATLPSGVSLSSYASSSQSTASSTTSYQRPQWYDSDVDVDEELPKSNSSVTLTKQERKIQDVINELIHTEQKHVRNLKIMKNHFYIPIKAEIYLTEDERNLLFPNLDEILELHCT